VSERSERTIGAITPLVDGHRPGQVIATISSLLPSLLPTEQAVATVLLERSASIVELTSQQVAELAGASRATVVRTCQSLGFTGYQQLRVLLARDAGYRDDTTATVPDPTDGSAIALVSRVFNRVATGVPGMLALLDPAATEQMVTTLAEAARLVVVGNGLSATLALDVAARLTAFGRPAEAPIDVIHQQVSARLLAPGDALVVISGSGSNAASLRAAEAATEAGASVAAITSFSRSPLAQLADVVLVVTMPDVTFREEINVTSRVPQTILVEGLVAAVAARLGDRAVQARAVSLDVVANNLDE